jgi:hypothetical protein
MAGPTGVESSYLVQGLNANERKLFLNYFREESHSAGSYISKRTTRATHSMSRSPVSCRLGGGSC